MNYNVQLLTYIDTYHRLLVFTQHFYLHAVLMKMDSDVGLRHILLNVITSGGVLPDHDYCFQRRITSLVSCAFSLWITTSCYETDLRVIQAGPFFSSASFPAFPVNEYIIYT